MASWIYFEFAIWTGETITGQSGPSAGKNGPSDPGASLMGVIDSYDDLLQPRHRWLAQHQLGYNQI